MTLAQTCKPLSIQETTPEAQFIERPDGTLKDGRTGLIWSRCSLGQHYVDQSCSGDPLFFDSWGEALAAVEQANAESSHDDWRMPDIKELGTLVERSCSGPAINLTLFPDTPAESYYSSTPFASLRLGYDYTARAINFSDGTEFDPTNAAKFALRLVRGPISED
jgi:hypothetical protein